MATLTFPRLFAVCGLALPAGARGQAERLKDLASIAGVRQNQLMGYGLVVGLDGSGDQTTQTPFTVQSVAAMLQQLGVNCRKARAATEKRGRRDGDDGLARLPSRASCSTSRCRRWAMPKACAAARC
jgi:hypothetical protein